jgi:putative acetyltransferase
MSVQIATVTVTAPPAQLESIRQLWREYAAMPHTIGRWMTVDADIAALPMPFTGGESILLLAHRDDVPLGCGALRPLEPGIGEIKRVYVRPAARGLGVGRQIMDALLSSAAQAGCHRVRLDTAPELLAAQALYHELGFVRIPPYRDGLLPDTLFFEKVLGSSRSSARP